MFHPGKYCDGGLLVNVKKHNERLVKSRGWSKYRTPSGFIVESSSGVIPEGSSAGHNNISKRWDSSKYDP